MFSLPKLDRYIGYEILRIFVAILVILILILIGGSLVKMLRLAANGVVPADAVFSLLSLETLRLSGRLIPAAFFFATVFSLSRMYQELEISALLSSGIGPAKLYRVVLLTAIPLALISAWLVLDIYPKAGRVVEKLKEQNSDALLVSAMEGGRFYEARGGSLVFYAKAADVKSGELENAFIHQRRADEKVIVTTADKGYHHLDESNGRRTVVLFDGYQYSGNPGQSESSVIDFERLSITVNAEAGVRARRDLDRMDTMDVFMDKSIKARANFQSRIVFPFSVIAFGLLAVPLSRVNVRQNAYGRMVLAIVLFLVFMLFQTSSETWMIKGITPEWAGVWWVAVAMLLIAVILELIERRRFVKGGRDAEN